MKNHGILTWIFLIISCSAGAQNINWASLKEENKHLLHAGTGLEYAAVFGAGYGYQFKTKLFPVLANVDYSFPSGNKITDDFKTRIGVQVPLLKYRDFRFSASVKGVFRRYENDYVRLLNFGIDMSGMIGYYRPRWFLAGEAGFDKAIVTHFKHGEAYRSQYPGAVNGWYEPATGGNFYYGLQAGVSFGKHDLSLRAGKVLTQDFRTGPLLPFYGQLAYNLRFGGTR